jgi:LmbE family N-acetylglucosaminyl deacetylase
MKKTLVVAPHPDDELLGCGGTILRRHAEGGIVGWLIMTNLQQEWCFSQQQIATRALEIEQVRARLGVSPKHLYQLCFPTTRLDTIPMANLVGAVSDVFHDFQPEEVFVPHPGDIHSDHRISFEAVTACTKWFRYPFVRKVCVYETLSETDFNLQKDKVFKPNLYIDISIYLEKKLELLQVYRTELGNFPFPRSEQALRSLAALRGSASGFNASEAFELLFERF